MDIVDQLKTKHENDGKEGSFSKRLPGFTWIGYDPSGITKGEKAIRKAAWICTPVSASSTTQVMTNVQQLGKDLLTSNFPMDMHIAELLISDNSAKKLNVKLSILQRTPSSWTRASRRTHSATTARTRNRLTRSLLPDALSTMM